MFKSVGGVIYLIIGFIVAQRHGYLAVGDLDSLVSAVLGVLLWPLVLFGVNLRLPS